MILRKALLCLDLLNCLERTAKALDCLDRSEVTLMAEEGS